MRGPWWLVGAVVLVMALGVAAHGISQPTDVAQYARFAAAAIKDPGRAWPREYPPLSLLVFLLPTALPLSYALAFPLTAGAVLLALSAWGQRAVGPDWARRFLLYLVVGGVALVTARYDIVPSACLFVAALSMHQGRYRRAWVWSTLGAALKLFPLVVWPFLMLAEWRATGRWPWRETAWSGAALGALLAIPRFFAVGRLSWLHYFDTRPPNIGAFAGQLSALFHPAYAMYASFGSVDVIGPGTASIALVITGLGVVAFAAVVWAQWTLRLEPLAAVLVGLTVLVLASKVVSVQYLLWLMPLWALYAYSKGFLWTGVLNTLSYPVMFSLYTGDPITLGRWLLTVLFARNAVLLLSTVSFVRREWRQRAAPVPLPTLKGQFG